MLSGGLRLLLFKQVHVEGTSINLVGSQQFRLIAPSQPGDRPATPGHPSVCRSGHQGPELFLKTAARPAFPLPACFPASRRRGRAADGTAQMRSSWGLSPRLVEQPPLRWRPAGRPPGGFGLRRFRIQVGEDLLDDQPSDLSCDDVRKTFSIRPAPQDRRKARPCLGTLHVHRVWCLSAYKDNSNTGRVSRRVHTVDVAITLATVAHTRPPSGAAGEVLLEVLGQ